jgi:hypothetical protein
MVPVGPGYAAEWRERVRAYWAKRARKFKVGDVVVIGDAQYTLVESLAQRGWRAKDVFGDTWRIPNRRMPDAEVLK